jgi:hypothetical protein
MGCHGGLEPRFTAERAVNRDDNHQQHGQCRPG